MSGLARQSIADLRSDVHVAVGDAVSTGENVRPLYRVIAVTEDRAWIRDIQHGTDHVVPVDRCRKIDGGGA